MTSNHADPQAKGQNLRLAESRRLRSSYGNITGARREPQQYLLQVLAHADSTCFEHRQDTPEVSRRTMRISTSFVAAVCIWSFFGSASSLSAGSPIYVGSKASPRVSLDQIDHSRWNAILNAYVDTDGMVNYQALKASAADVAKLDRYLAGLSSADPSIAATKPAKLAFWINAYNAVTVRGILREYPTSSIRNHTARLFGYNIWKDLKLYVGGQAYSLEQIEHEILRKMSEPRIHFAIVCASVGCPRLLGEAYVGDRLESQLQANAKDFFARSRNFRYDKSGQRFYLSSILSWFAEDFGSSQAAQLRTISPWLPTTGATDAAKRNGVGISYLDYDWSLNKQ
jgi:hypothetical protein